MTEETLKPCPFCGGRAEFIISDECYSYRFKVRCTKCHVVNGGSAFENNNYNASIWNRRV